MIKSSISSKAQKDDKLKVKLGIKPDENDKYLPKQKGWREFSGYLKNSPYYNK